MAIQRATPLEANGARTSDWIGRIKGHVIYAYDLGSPTTSSARFIDFTIKDFDEQILDLSDDLGEPREDVLAVGYNEMAVDNGELAENSLPIALETWPPWNA